MATSSTVFCGICDGQHITKSADSWCPECEEGFCSECLKHHNVSKYTKSHEVLSIENYQKLPPDVSNIVHHCPEHEKRYQNYCSKHESLCCPLCISTSHRECVGLLAIDELIKSSKTSTTIDNMARSLKDIGVNLEKVIQNREDNLVSIAKERQKYIDEIKQARKKLNDHFDTLERNIIEDLNTAEKKIKAEFDNLLRNLRKRSRTIEELKNNLTTVTTYGSDLQTFFSTKSMQANVDREEKYIQSLSEDDKLKEISLELRIDGKIANVLSTITSFGSVSTVKGLPFKFKSEKDKQAQFFAAIQLFDPPTLGTINLSLKRKCKIPKGVHTVGARGCVCNIAGKLIAVDNHSIFVSNNRLVILNSDGALDHELSLSIYPADVTNIDDNHVAVSSYNHVALSSYNQQILIINTELKTITRTINTPNTSNCLAGIAYKNNKLYYIESGNGIHVLDLSSGLQSTLVSDKSISGRSRITTYKDNIYYTNNKTNTVTCCTVTGKKKWEFKDASVLVNPRGIAVDARLNVYVASGDHAIVVISHDGNQARRILRKDNGICYPLAVHFDAVRNYLVVANFSGEIFLFSIN